MTSQPPVTSNHTRAGGQKPLGRSEQDLEQARQSDPIPIDRLLRRKAKALSAGLVLKVSEWVQAERKKRGITQRSMARQYGIPERQIATYEAIAKWSPAVKAFIRENPAQFRVTDLTRLFANRSWRTEGTLLNALKRHAVGKPPRKRRGSISQAQPRDPDLQAIEDRLRDQLKTRIELRGNGHTGELVVSYFSMHDLERFITLLEK